MGTGGSALEMQPARSLQPTAATSNPSLSKTNLLAELDKTAQDVIGAILDAQASDQAGSPVVEVAGLSQPFALRRRLSLPEMRRHKRGFVKLLTQNSYTKLQNAEQGRQMFVDFLQNAVTT